MKTIEALQSELCLMEEIYEYFVSELLEEYSEETQEKIYLALRYIDTIQDQIVQAFCNTIRDEEYIEI